MRNSFSQNWKTHPNWIGFFGNFWIKLTSSTRCYHPTKTITLWIYFWQDPNGRTTKAICNAPGRNYSAHSSEYNTILLGDWGWKQRHPTETLQKTIQRIPVSTTEREGIYWLHLFLQQNFSRTQWGTVLSRRYLKEVVLPSTQDWIPVYDGVTRLYSRTRRSWHYAQR